MEPDTMPITKRFGLVWMTIGFLFFHVGLSIAVFNTEAENATKLVSFTLVRRRLHFLRRNAIGYCSVQNGNEKYMISLLCWCCWSGTGGKGGVEAQDQTSVGVILKQWELNPQPPANRT